MLKRFLALCLCLLLLGSAAAEQGAYRALCIGISRYEDGRTRVGGENSTQGVFDALSQSLSGEQGGFNCQLVLNTGYDGFFDAIDCAFTEAMEGDVSLLYVNAHGGAEEGISFIELADGNRVTATDLAGALSVYPGRVVLLLDFCNSGGFVGSATGEESAFGDAFALNSFASDKFLTIVSCALDEKSYRVADGSTEEEKVSTVFARALCEALGWDLIADRPTSLRADTDRSRTVTFSEIVSYTRRRCMYYLSSSSASRQTVCSYPEADSFLLAVRN